MENKITFFSIENGQSVFSTENEKNTIGRTDQSDFVMPFSSISRDHGEIFLYGNRWVLIDRASTNGTFVNDMQLVAHKPQIIDEGDQVVFGTFGTRIETVTNSSNVPSLLLFNADKYEGNFKIDNDTTFIYGGPQSTIRRSGTDEEVVFVVRQENSTLLIQRRSDEVQILHNSIPLIGNMILSDRDIIEIEGLSFIISSSTKPISIRSDSNSDNSEENDHQPVPDYLKSRMGGDSWNDPYQEKLKNFENKLSMDVPVLEEKQTDKPSKSIPRSELGVQRFSRPSLETIKKTEIAKEKQYALFGIITLVILLGMISILFNLYSKVIF